MKLCLLPEPSKLPPTHGIGRVLHAQHQYLPAYGFEFVQDDSADLFIGHTQQFNMPRIDIMCCHGLYWTGDQGSGQYNNYSNAANKSILDAARRARAIVVPSNWVAMPFKRDMHINPVVIGHGIDTAEWQIGRPQGYLLWNKNRNFDVCNPQPAYEMAKRGLEVVTTFAPPNVRRSKNLQVIGLQDQAQMKQIISGAAVYLATTKETFGIGTLEAMACGVPVLGFDFGGTADLVTSGVDGILVKPYDYDALHNGYIHIMQHRAEMSAAARAKALRYDWSVAIAQYADLFKQVYEAIQDEPRGVSFVITSYNYGRYVCEAVDSVLNQTMPPTEVIVVDDGSKDDTLEQLAKYKGMGVKVIHQQNQGVAAARTVGIEHATQPYITLLDADDKLEPTFAATLLPALHSDRALGIAYTGLVGFTDAGAEHKTDFPPEFSWNHQAQNTNPPANCIPSACMFRREMWERAGPHKQEYAPGEDAEFWTRGLSVGFTAKKITKEPLFRYRLHTGSATRTREYKPIDDRLPWLRDHIFPMAAPMDGDSVPEVRSYSQPAVAVIIAVLPGRARFLEESIDCILGQTLREWELIIVDDTFKNNTTEINPALIRRYPFINFVVDGRRRGLNAARNFGLSEAKAPMVLFLDPGDVLLPNALGELARGLEKSEGFYTYGNTQIIKQVGSPQVFRAADYPAVVQSEARIPKIAALYPLDWIMDIGGFDESIAYDENDLLVRLALKKYCGLHIDKTLLVYREYLSPNGKVPQFGGARLRGEVMGGCCGGNAAAVLAAKMAINAMPNDVNTYAGDPVAGLVLMNYTGQNVGSYTFNANGGRTYQGGNNDIQRQAWVHPSDVAVLERTSKWVVAPEPPKPQAKAEEKPVEIIAAEAAPVETIAAAPQVEAVETIAAVPVVEAVATMTPVPEVKVTTDSLTRKRRKKGL